MRYSGIPSLAPLATMPGRGHCAELVLATRRIIPGLTRYNMVTVRDIPGRVLQGPGLPGKTCPKSLDHGTCLPKRRDVPRPSKSRGQHYAEWVPEAVLLSRLNQLTSIPAVLGTPPAGTGVVGISVPRVNWVWRSGTLVAFPKPQDLKEKYELQSAACNLRKKARIRGSDFSIASKGWRQLPLCEETCCPRFSTLNKESGSVL
ncbi:hypothetical protein K440DRAFT_620188 [Wilcoxina mikolae CBS 423.85]|nr:hypothetical protein K440DRAFT_620188 [Wilcoxina mikolae CBS 423.85]